MTDVLIHDPELARVIWSLAKEGDRKSPAYSKWLRTVEMLAEASGIEFVIPYSSANSQQRRKGRVRIACAGLRPELYERLEKTVERLNTTKQEFVRTAIAFLLWLLEEPEEPGDGI